MANRLCLCGSILMGVLGSDRRQQSRSPCKSNATSPFLPTRALNIPSPPHNPKWLPCSPPPLPTAGQPPRNQPSRSTYKTRTGTIFLQTSQHYRACRHNSRYVNILCSRSCVGWALAHREKKNMRIAWDGNDGIPDGLTMFDRSSKWMALGIWVMMYVSVTQS